jgi:hypothetical protein
VEKIDVVSKNFIEGFSSLKPGFKPGEAHAELEADKVVSRSISPANYHFTTVPCAVIIRD